jgi:hypothetical protein
MQIAKRGLTVLALWALVLSFGAGAISVHIERVYLSTHSLYFDHVSYCYYNARLYQRWVLGESRWALAWEEWVNNARHPARTVPLLLLAPSLLAHPMGHMATVLPALAVFLFLLGYTIWRRSGSSVYAGGAMLLFCTLPGLYHVTYGLASYLLDLPAALYIGAGLFCLLWSEGARRPGWLVMFAVLVSWGCLGRWVAGGYALVLGGPVLAFYLWRRWREERSFLRAVVVPALWVGVPVVLLAGWFIVAHWETNFDFYPVYGYGLGGTLWGATLNTARGIAMFFSRKVLLVLGAILLANLFWLRARGQDMAQQAGVVWFAVGHPFLQIPILHVIRDLHNSNFTAPGLFLAALAPVRWKNRDLRRKWTLWVLGILLALGCAAGAHASWAQYQRALHPSPRQWAQKELDRALARVLARQDGRILWLAAFNEYSWIPTMEAFYSSGKLILPAGQDYFFGNHISMWKGNYPGLKPEQIGPRVYANIKRYVDVVVVFHDPATITGVFDNPYAEAVARYLARRVAQDPTWRLMEVIPSRRFGPLAVYRNTAPQNQGAYGKVLRGEALVSPSRDEEKESPRG